MANAFATADAAATQVVGPPPPAPPEPPAAPALVERSPAAAFVDVNATGRRALLRVSRVITVVGVLALLLIAYEFGVSGVPEARAQAALLATFKLQLPTTRLDSPATAQPEGTAIALIDIPAIGVHQVVVEGSTPDDLKSGPGHLRATPLPGEFGNAVIAGRRTTYGAPFGQLDQLRKGDVIDITTGQGKLTYVVSRVAHVNPGQPDPISSTLDSRLTLLTSDPRFIASGRLAVVAMLHGAPLALAARPPVPTGNVDLGLSGDPIGLALGFVWLELLATAAFVAWRVRQRLPRSVLYMFAAPVMLTLAMLAFSSLDSMMPGTM